MKGIAVGVMMLILMASSALAHEHRVIMIGQDHYEFTVGSLGEPVYVDDKSGVQMMVKHLGEMTSEQREAEESDHSSHDVSGVETPVTGLEKTWQVEISANGAKKVLPFGAAYGKPGEYHAVFYPTAATEFSYRVFGEVDGTPVNLLFECNPAGHVMEAEEEASLKKLSENVWLMSKGGQFGCPKSRADAAFPNTVMSSAQSQEGWKQAGRLNNFLATSALLVGIVAIALAVRKKGRK
jgi:hypothetical protein